MRDRDKKSFTVTKLLKSRLDKNYKCSTELVSFVCSSPVKAHYSQFGLHGQITINVEEEENTDLYNHSYVYID